MIFHLFDFGAGPTAGGGPGSPKKLSYAGPRAKSATLGGEGFSKMGGAVRHRGSRAYRGKGALHQARAGTGGG